MYLHFTVEYLLELLHLLHIICTLDRFENSFTFSFKAIDCQNFFIFAAKYLDNKVIVYLQSRVIPKNVYLVSLNAHNLHWVSQIFLYYVTLAERMLLVEEYFLSISIYLILRLISLIGIRIFQSSSLFFKLTNIYKYK